MFSALSMNLIKFWLKLPLATYAISDFSKRKKVRLSPVMNTASYVQGRLSHVEPNQVPKESFNQAKWEKSVYKESNRKRNQHTSRAPHWIMSDSYSGHRELWSKPASVYLRKMTKVLCLWWSYFLWLAITIDFGDYVYKSTSIISIY